MTLPSNDSTGNSNGTAGLIMFSLMIRKKFDAFIDPPLTHQTVLRDERTYLHNYAAAINPDARLRASSFLHYDCRSVIPRITRALLCLSSPPLPHVLSSPRTKCFPPIYIYPTDSCRGSTRSSTRSSVIRSRRCENRGSGKESNDTLPRSVLRED